MNATRHHLVHDFVHFWKPATSRPAKTSEEKSDVRNFWIVLLWILIAALVMYLVWLANLPSIGTLAPPWSLPIA